MKENKARDKKSLFPRRAHIPFTQPLRCKEMDGVYRSIGSGYIHVLKNVWLRGFVSADGLEAYDSYTASIKSTSPEIGTHRRIVLENVPWEFLLKL